MGKATMMSESVSRPFESPKHVEVWSFGGENHSCSSEGGLRLNPARPSTAPVRK
jgi:hypothetical protein